MKLVVVICEPLNQVFPSVDSCQNTEGSRLTAGPGTETELLSYDARLAERVHGDRRCHGRAYDECGGGRGGVGEGPVAEHSLVRAILARVTSLTVRVSAVAPVMGEKVLPPSVETCHCTVGAGNPLAPAEKVSVLPGKDRLVARFGSHTGRVRRHDECGGGRGGVGEGPVAEHSLVLVAILGKGDVADGQGVSGGPSDGGEGAAAVRETCHCTVGAGNPLAPAEKVASCPAKTDWLPGSAVTVGAVSGTSTMA